MEEFIDPYHYERRYEVVVGRFRNSRIISKRNKELILDFLRDAALGKTIFGRARKKVGYSRRLSYLGHLCILIRFVKKNLDKLTQEDMEKFIVALESGKITSRSPRVVGNRVVRSAQPLRPMYQVHIKMTIRKFYKWLWGDGKEHPPLVRWIDTYIELQEISALTEQEVERVVDRCKTPFQRAVVQVLFDGGFRIGEILNVRLKHVRLRQVGDDSKSKFFVIRIPFSKTLRRTVVLPMHATTKWLLMWLEDHPGHVQVLENGELSGNNLESQLFPCSGSKIRDFLEIVGEKAIKKHVYPHLLRHTSATYWSNRLPFFKFCKRFGWTMTSSMPQRYIDREGVDELEAAEIYHNDERAKLVKEKQDLLMELALKGSVEEVERKEQIRE